MSSEYAQASLYSLGTPHPNTRTHPRVETKPGYDTGRGYERVRSYEHRPHTPRQGKESVYASIHRLCAVAWCFPDGETAEDIDLRGKDVHHGVSDEWDSERGCEWLNVHDSPNLPGAALEVLDHGEHSSVTNRDKRAWAEDAKRSVAREDEPDRCPDCGEEAQTWATSPAVEGHECLRCVTRKTDDGEIVVRR